MKFTEIEFKFRADNIALSDFQNFCESRSPSKTIIASGFDHFFYNPKDPDSFYRHRIGPDMCQLTYKKKKNDTNNVIRDEQNMNLSQTETSQSVAAFLARFNYTYNTSLFKTCFVYVYEQYILVYYVVYDKDMKELGRFIEIEMSEEHSWPSEQAAYNELVLIEKLCRPLGITPQARVKKSLFELYRKPS